MAEIVPIVLGLVSGLIVGASTVHYPVLRWLLASLLLGVAATVLTGEWRLSWAYIAVDVPLVAFASAVGFALARKTRQRRAPAARQA